MHSLKKKLNKDKLIAYCLSILIHAILFFILLFVWIQYFPTKNTSTILQLVEVTPPKPKKIETAKPLPPKKIIHHEKEVKHEENVSQKPKKPEIAARDTIKTKQQIVIPENVLTDSTGQNLKFAATLLDTLLARHPEFAQYILKEKSKELVQDKNNKAFSRLEMEIKINNELHKYLKEHFPEGSEHAMSDIGGKGMQIPIDGLIDAIRKIF